MRVWVDIENAPQAWFFRPLLPALRARGAEVLVTARDYGEAVGLLAAAGEAFDVVGATAGASRLARGASVIGRALVLARFARGRHIDVAASHGVRPHLAAAALLRIPCVTGYDYEHASKLLVHRLACEVLVPRVVRDHLCAIGADVRKLSGYDGLKEELYLHQFEPDDSIYASLDLDPRVPIITVRPPSFHAHYANDEGNRLFFDVLQALRPRHAQLVVTARDAAQRRVVREICRGDERVRVPDQPVDGLNLIWHSDVVISGGGTMAREAALLGAPAISIFRGALGAVDAHLADTGRLRRIASAAELNGVGTTVSRMERLRPAPRTDLIDFVVDRILSHA